MLYLYYVANILCEFICFAVAENEKCEVEGAHLFFNRVNSLCYILFIMLISFIFVCISSHISFFYSWC